MRIQTHMSIDGSLCGKAVFLGPGEAEVAMTATAAMAADDKGLVHGGFIFGMADYAAMLAVNHPNVVLGSAETKFLKPVAVGELLLAKARVIQEAGKKRIVTVSVTRDGIEVVQGTFTCFVLEQHVLE